jgi:hypothetical protein
MPVYNRYYSDSNNQIDTPESRVLLTQQGPCIPVAIAVPQQLAQVLQGLGQPVPPAVTGLALIDTGASICAIDEDALRKLGIPPFGYMPILTPAGQGTQPTYPASLSFPGTPLPNVSFANFVGSPLAQQGILALIGRNVLQDFVLHYNGPGSHFSLAF